MTADATLARPTDRSAQRRHVRDVLLDGDWHTHLEIQTVIQARRNAYYPETSIASRIRDLRMPEYGGYYIPRRQHPHIPRVFQYRIVLPGNE